MTVTLATVTTCTLNLTTGLGDANTFKGVGMFWTDTNETAVVGAAWRASGSIDSAFKTTRNKNTDPIVGYYPTPTDES